MKKHACSDIRFAALIAAASLIALVGCAAPSPPRPLGDATQRLEFNGFSVMPPRGSGWYITDSEYGVAFFIKLPSDPLASSNGVIQVPRTFFVAVSLMRPGLMDVSSPDALKREVQKSLSADTDGNQTLVDSKITPYSIQGTDCVRYEATYEVRNHAAAPGGVLAMPGAGFVCRHPLSPDQAIHGTYSERRIQGLPPGPADTHRSEAEAVMASVLFTSPGKR